MFLKFPVVSISFVIFITNVHGATVCPQCDQNLLQKCPCVKPLGSMECMSYDPRYMATSIDEAMFSFPNLASYDGSPLFDKTQQAPAMGAPANFMANSIMVGNVEHDGSAHDKCETRDCMECKLSIVNGFIDNSMATNDTLWSTKQQLQSRTGQSSGSCSRLTPQPSGAPGGIVELTSSNQKTAKSENDKKAEQVISILGDKKNNKKKKVKRQASTDKDKLLGITNQIGCDYRRGAALDGDDKWSGLCNLCWQWRRLPDKYFPNYINEVSCDSNDSGCLAGFGSCRAVIRMLNILQNVGTKDLPKWEQVTIESAAACECQVEVGTPLHALVTK